MTTPVLAKQVREGLLDSMPRHLPSALLSLLCTSLLCMPLSAATLTLEQAMQRANEAGFDVRIGREASEQAQARVGQARAGLLPSLSASATQRRTQGVSILDDVAVTNARGDRFDGKLSADLTLVDARLYSTLKAARKGTQVAEEELNALKESLLAQVAKAFFTHQRNLRRRSVIDANIQRAQTLYELAKNQAAAGAATQIEVTRAEAQLAQAEQARLQQQTVIVEGSLSLKQLLALPLEEPLELSGNGLSRVTAEEKPLAQGEDSYLKRADYAAAVKTLEQSKLELLAARAQRLPSLSLNGEYGAAAPNFGGGYKQAWTAAGVVSVPVFDGSKTSADTRLALSRLRAQEVRVARLALQIDAEQRLAVQDSRSRQAQVLVAEKTLKLAEEEMTLARLRYEQDIADNREVVEAQTRMAAAADTLVEAEYLYQLSRVELHRSQGDVSAILKDM